MKEDKAQEAMAAFKQAAAIRPKSATIYSEISWLAFTLKDYSVARSAAAKSILHGKEQPIVQAMSYYNVGRAHEAEGDKESALENYVSSYKLRQNKVVAKRLKSLGGQLPESVWTATPLSGPYANLKDFCAPLGLSDTSQGGATAKKKAASIWSIGSMYQSAASARAAFPAAMVRCYWRSAGNTTT
jgi:tetratricopeptide (TPR) repeat protein